jgi:hypothetical protein
MATVKYSGAIFESELAPRFLSIPITLINLKYSKLELFAISYAVIGSEIRMVFNEQLFEVVAAVDRAAEVAPWRAIEVAVSELQEQYV